MKPQLPGDTRWNSSSDADTYIRNRPFMLMIAAQNEDIIESRIRNIIYNVGLFSEAKHLHSQLEPIADALNRLQGDATSIADACEVWLSLLSSRSLEPYKEKVEKRFHQAMTPCHYLANIMHPLFKGKKLKPCHISEAQDMMMKFHPDLLPDFLTLLSDTMKLPKALQDEKTMTSIKPGVWRICAERSKLFQDTFCQCAQKLLQMPASSASIERIFSNFGLIQTKLRNKPGVEKAGKLVFCYRMLRGNEDLEW